ncbi:uncharacterized protein LOC132697252 [Cylas formicarius]|uniref:uncharacterized protein LOC132697252 n=1 Tax=Cylas formicarius TaxID=197179 RepID=UPI002958CB7E|nr:uncharacterized protein LOC132697252 [Cylas formicarius]
MPKKQVEVVVRPRAQSRRAASKEALKQMQILLGDEDDDAVEIPDDDDEVIPIPVVVSPPRKKYKLTHRKSSDGNDREVLVLKSISSPAPPVAEVSQPPPMKLNHEGENNLELECWPEDLEPCQKQRNEAIQNEQRELDAKLDELIKSCKGEVIYKGNLTTLIEVGEQIQKTISVVKETQQSNIILNNSVSNMGGGHQAAGYQLVMDPRLGIIVGTVQTPQASKPMSKVQVSANVQPAGVSNVATRSRITRKNKIQTPAIGAGTAVLSTASSGIGTRSVVSSSKQLNKRMVASPIGPPATRARVSEASAKVKQVTAKATEIPSGSGGANPKPTETNVEGGLSTNGGNLRLKAFVDLTSDDGKPLPDSREISFNKLQGKTYPSLVVVARPHLRVVDVNTDRSTLDAKVKSVLMYAPTKFTEWLIQQGLVKSEQKCSIHVNNQLKLGMYSDVSKFPYSGGYVWISECCPQRFVSVFSGSIFEGSPHPPLVILKILYHWACQTNIQNVTQWVKVDNLYVKGMYTWLRSICSVALQTHIRQLGGPQTKVEVGVISLGTTSQDGNSRQVKVEVLGILETQSKLIRLRAIEPLADGDRNYRKRFSKILEPLARWVHPASTIITDLTVDKATLHQMGFTHVAQTTSGDTTNSNRTIMEYLRRIVPRMFQNTLSLLSRQIIQQFLDELVWREWFGTTSMQAFDNLIIHLAEQTRFESAQSLIVRLNRVAMNPFKNWAIAASAAAAAPSSTGAAKTIDCGKKRKRKEATSEAAAPKTTTQASEAVQVARPPKSTSPDVPEQLVPLENYYYGTISHYQPKTNITLNMKCPMCKESFDNNIVLMNHLFKHAHNVSTDGQMCRYCLTSAPTANDLMKHIAISHPTETKFDNGFVCLICETQYMNPFVLGKHMSKEHCPSELPYQCGTCGHRCSNHKQAIDHFYNQHDSGPTIQCPFCLKSTTVFSSSRNIVQNMTFFIQHLQKHQRKQFARRCGKCNLWFVQKDVYKDHQTKMHVSQRGKNGLIPWSAPRNGVMVPKSKMDKYPCDAEGINFEKLFFNLPKNLCCKECVTPIDSSKHFPSFESCQNPNCQYSTCCSNAMQEHNAKCSKNPTAPSVAEEPLPTEMFCVCGYGNGDGNQMAKHLAICERKSAYPSLQEAKGASVTHSMLDVLGLVRKPEEAVKKDEEVVVVVPDDDKAEEVKEFDCVELVKEPHAQEDANASSVPVEEEGAEETNVAEEETNYECEKPLEEVEPPVSDVDGASQKDRDLLEVDAVESRTADPEEVEMQIENSDMSVNIDKQGDSQKNELVESVPEAETAVAPSEDKNEVEPMAIQDAEDGRSPDAEIDADEQTKAAEIKEDVRAVSD